jgi:hypothetical protein
VSRYRKSIAGALGALATWGLTAGADGHYTQAELWGLLAAAAAVVAVWGASNDPPLAAPARADKTTDVGLSVMEPLMAVVLLLVIVALVVWLAPRLGN